MIKSLHQNPNSSCQSKTGIIVDKEIDNVNDIDHFNESRANEMYNIYKMFF